MTAVTLDGFYYDGKTSRRQPVRVTFSGNAIAVEQESGRRYESLANVIVSERLASAPRTLTFRDGAYCEIPQSAELDLALAAAGHGLGRVEVWQISGRIVAMCLLVLLVAAFCGYQYGMPALARVAAARMPHSVAEHLSRQALAQADDDLLAPSTLLAQRRTTLQERFTWLRPAEGEEAVAALQFRSAPDIGPNAFALPDGTLVVTDELVRLADSDDQILAVIAHELGHVHFRHSLRNLLQSSAIAAFMTAWVGDVSSMAALIPAIALQTRYTREFELEADAYGAVILKNHGLSPALLGKMLDNLEVAVRGEHADERADDEVGSFFATHPSSKERIEALKALE